MGDGTCRGAQVAILPEQVTRSEFRPSFKIPMLTTLPAPVVGLEVLPQPLSAESAKAKGRDGARSLCFGESFSGVDCRSPADEPHSIRSQKTSNREAFSWAPTCDCAAAFSPTSPTKSARLTCGPSAKAERTKTNALKRRRQLRNAKRRYRSDWPARMMVGSPIHAKEKIALAMLTKGGSEFKSKSDESEEKS